jgi:hypothetical protein
MNPSALLGRTQVPLGGPEYPRADPSTLGRTRVPSGGPEYPRADPSTLGRTRVPSGVGPGYPRWPPAHFLRLRSGHGCCARRNPPTRTRCRGSRGGGGQVEAQGGRVIAAEEVGHVDEGTTALAELPAPKIEVFMVTMRKKRICPLCPRIQVFLGTKCKGNTC